MREFKKDKQYKTLLTVSLSRSASGVVTLIGLLPTSSSRIPEPSARSGLAINICTYAAKYIIYLKKSSHYPQNAVDP